VGRGAHAAARILSAQAQAAAAENEHAMFNIVLVHPEIPPNTGNVIRLAANTGCSLHLIEPLGFSMDDKLLQRAGLDYHEHASVQRHASWPAFVQAANPDPARLFAFTTRGSARFTEVRWQAGDWLVFGSETAGLPDALRNSLAASQRLRLPLRAGQRSLNLSNAVAVAVFEAWRQCGYAGGE
jgi:tRNA (cytidine/uridine-2'-O-)-methyltransferase